MAKQKTSLTQVNTQYFYAQIGTEIAAGTKSFPGSVASGFTLSGNSIVCNVPGTYFIYARQLISTNANQIYWQIRKNTVANAYGYPPNNTSTRDVFASTTMVLAAGDYIDIFQTASIASAWAGEHSHITVIRIA